MKTIKTMMKIAPCLQCGSTRIDLIDFGFHSFNQAGGECLDCGRKVWENVHAPTDAEVIRIWNAENDLGLLVEREEQAIRDARARRDGWLSKWLEPVKPEELVLTPEDFAVMEGAELGVDDGMGYWGTTTHRSRLSVREPQPDWATHVVWVAR